MSYIHAMLFCRHRLDALEDALAHQEQAAKQFSNLFFFFLFIGAPLLTSLYIFSGDLYFCAFTLLLSFVPRYFPLSVLLLSFCSQHHNSLGNNTSGSAVALCGKICGKRSRQKGCTPLSILRRGRVASWQWAPRCLCPRSETWSRDWWTHRASRTQ